MKPEDKTRILITLRGKIRGIRFEKDKRYRKLLGELNSIELT
jgi:hypothetical protein